MEQIARAEWERTGARGDIASDGQEDHAYLNNTSRKNRRQTERSFFLSFMR